MEVLKWYLKVQDTISEWVGRVISWLILIIIGILLYEVFARYIFNKPTVWAHELSTMMYGGFCVLALCYTQKHNAHVRIDVIYSLLPEKAKNIIDVILGAAALVVFSIFLKLSYDFAASSWAIGEISYRSPWRPALYPYKTLVPIGIGLMILQMIARFIRDVALVLGVDLDKPSLQSSEI